MRQRFSLLFALALAASMTFACSRKNGSESSGDSRPAEGKSAEPTDAKAIPDGVQLLSAGRAPYSQPRWKFQVGQTQDAELKNQLRMRTTMGVQPMPESVSPPMTFQVRVEVTDLSPDRTAQLQFKVLDANVDKLESVAPEVYQAVQRSVASTVGVTGQYQVDELGHIRQFQLNDTPAFKQADKAVLEQLERLIDTTLIPLPEAKIGEGAKWTYGDTFEEGGVTIRQTSTYELTELDENSIHTEISVHRTAEKQKVSSGTDADGAGYELLSLATDGSGSTEGALHAMVPGLATMSTRSTMRMLLPGQEGQAPQSLQMEVNTRSTVRAR